MNVFVKYSLSYSDLTVNLQDTAPLLGYEDDLPDDVLDIVREVMDETAGCFDICGGYQIFDDIVFDADKRQINVAGVDFTPQKIVYHQLKNSECIAVFVCTAGEGISQWSKKMMAANEPLKGYIADVLGSVVAETAIEAIENKLRDEISQKGLKITNRYSPGYCGWDTAEQHKLFRLLSDENCGIHLTESALMQPVKSVSGFIGIGKNVRFNPYTCQLCDAEFCVYRQIRCSKIKKQKTRQKST